MSHTAQTIELLQGEMRLALRPDVGASIAGLWLDGLPVLRSGDPAVLEAPRQSSGFPLAPYVGRLGYRRFRWQGQDYATQDNSPNMPHSIHGVAWQRPWRVLHADDSAAELGLTHVPDADWPFAFELRQRFELAPQSLTLRLAITNTAPTAQPVGLGWHPYFPRRGRSRLHAEVSHRWESDATVLPTRRVAQPGIDADVAHLQFDHIFEGWTGPARLRDERLSLRLSSSLPYLVVFTPPGQDWYCVEPVSHVANAIHMADPVAHGLRTLQPGEAFDAWMRLDVAPA